MIETNNTIKLEDLTIDELTALVGPHDYFIKILEDLFSVKITVRDHIFYLTGAIENCEYLNRVLETLLAQIRAGKMISEQDIIYVANLSKENKQDAYISLSRQPFTKTISGKSIYPKTLGQKEFLDQMIQKDIVFSIGPAGTGKTYLAVAYAVSLLKKGMVKRIVLTRPAVEAGESLGFLPGDLKEKVDPYLQPLYDALNEMLGAEQVLKYIESGTIEIAPLAYMRGRTLNEAFIILDEAQNATSAQIKMFLTRLGFQSKMIINGDITQIDLKYHQESGLQSAHKILKDIKEIAFVYLTSEDVVRHPLVQKIILAYQDEKNN